MVNQGPVYSGPAVMAPRPTYAPTPTASGYPYVSGQADRYEESAEYQSGNEYQPAPRYTVRRAAPARRVVYRRTPARRVVNVRNDLPAKKAGAKVIRARAEVRIYGPQRMDIRLYR
jgi:hypothetical protein